MASREVHPKTRQPITLVSCGQHGAVCLIRQHSPKRTQNCSPKQLYFLRITCDGHNQDIKKCLPDRGIRALSRVQLLACRSVRGYILNTGFNSSSPKSTIQHRPPAVQLYFTQRCSTPSVLPANEMGTPKAQQYTKGSITIRRHHQTKWDCIYSSYSSLWFSSCMFTNVGFSARFARRQASNVAYSS